MERTIYKFNETFMYAPRCPTCKREMKLLRLGQTKFAWGHKCRKSVKKKPIPSKTFITNCWNCTGQIDSRTAIKSKSGAGHHCPSCGEDLMGWRKIHRPEWVPQHKPVPTGVQVSV